MKMTFERFIEKYRFEKMDRELYCGDFEDESVDIYKWKEVYVMQVSIVCCDIVRTFVYHTMDELYEGFKKNVNTKMLQ